MPCLVDCQEEHDEIKYEGLAKYRLNIWRITKKVWL